MMKKITYYIAFILLLSVTACMNEKIESENSREPETIKFTANTCLTKTSLASDGVNVLWNPGDEIAVSGAKTSFKTNIQENKATAVFVGEAEPIVDKFYAAYPAVNVLGWPLAAQPKFTLPSAQNPVKGSFDKNVNLAVAMTTTTEMNLQFRNLLSYLKITITDEKIDEIDVSSIDEKKCPAGIFTYNIYTKKYEVSVPFKTICLNTTKKTILEPGDYYIAILPGVYNEGIRFQFFCKDKKAFRAIANSVTAEAGKIYNLGTIKNLNWI